MPPCAALPNRRTGYLRHPTHHVRGLVSIGSCLAVQHSSTVLPTTDRPTTDGPATDRAAGAPLIVRKFVIDKTPVFIDPSLAVIDVEQGEAGDQSVLQAQTTANGSLVYYATMVNDVYAYFMTGVKKGAFTTTTPNEFPTTAA